MHYSHMAEQKHYEVASAGAQMYRQGGGAQGFWFINYQLTFYFQ